MLNTDVKKQINTARDILVGKVPNPLSQIDLITNALIYKFMDDQDRLSQTLPGGKASFFIEKLEPFAWYKLFDSKLSNQDRANLYVEGIEKLSKAKNLPDLFKDIFKDAFLPFRDADTIAMFLNEINKFDYHHSEDLGNAFEYLLSIMGSQGDAGQFRTPRNIIEFIVDAVNPTKDEHILDPACGTAGFLVEAYKHITNETKLSPNEVQDLAKHIHGVDIDPGMAKIARVNLYLHGFKTPLVTEDDTLTNELLWGKKYDVILANPPFMTPKGGITPHDKFSIPSNRAEVLFTDYIAEHLKLEGRAGIVVPEGIIFQSSNTYKQLRKKLVDDNYLWGVISLPAGVFNPYSGVKTSILLLDRARATENSEIMFYKVEDDGFGLGAQRRESKKNDLPEALKAIENWRDGKKLEVSKVSYIKKIKISEDGDYNLDGARYSVSVDYSNTKWPMVKLGDENYFKIESGGTPSSKVKEYWNGDIKWATLVDLPASNFITEIHNTVRKISSTGLSNSSAKILPANSVIVSSRATIGRIAINTTEIATNQGFKNIVIQDASNVSNKYIAYVITGAVDEMKKLSSGGTFAEISKTNFSKIKIPLPPVGIQEQIVAELNGYSSIISGAKQIVDNWKPKIDIDSKWEKVKLGEVSNLMTGGTPLTSKKEYYGGEVKWLVSGDIHKNEIFDCEGRITELALQESNAKILPINSVLIALNGQGKTRGTVALLRTKASCNQSLVSINPDANKLLPEFLLYFLESIYLEIRKINGDKQRGGLNMPLIRKIEVLLPPLEIQKQFIEKIEAERELVESAKKLIEIYEQKIKDAVDNLWSE